MGRKKSAEDAVVNAVVKSIALSELSKAESLALWSRISDGKKRRPNENMSENVTMLKHSLSKRESAIVLKFAARLFQYCEAKNVTQETDRELDSFTDCDADKFLMRQYVAAYRKRLRGSSPTFFYAVGKLMTQSDYPPDLGFYYAVVNSEYDPELEDLIRTITTLRNQIESRFGKDKLEALGRLLEPEGAVFADAYAQLLCAGYDSVMKLRGVR